MSELLQADGVSWWPWEGLGVWADWVPLLKRAWSASGGGLNGLGAWNNRAAGGGDVVWGEGIRVTTLVRRRGVPLEAEGTFGVVTALGKPGMPAKIGVLWGCGHWCCPIAEVCARCGPLGAGGKLWLGEISHDEATVEWTEPGSLIRLWGGEPRAPVNARRHSFIVWAVRGLNAGPGDHETPGGEADLSRTEPIWEYRLQRCFRTSRTRPPCPPKPGATGLRMRWR